MTFFRRARLTDLGVAVRWAPLRLTIHEPVAIGIAAFMVMFVSFLSVAVRLGTMAPGNAIGLALFIGLTCVPSPGAALGQKGAFNLQAKILLQPLDVLRQRLDLSPVSGLACVDGKLHVDGYDPACGRGHGADFSLGELGMR